MTVSEVVAGVRAWPVWAPGTRPWRFGPPAGVAAVTACFVGFVGVVDPNRSGHYPTCPFLLITGYYCPGCGSLRAIHALAHGRPLEALDRNPLLVAVLPFLLAAYLGWARRRIWERPRTWLAPPAVIWGLLVVLIAFWVLRNLPAFSWLAP